MSSDLATLTARDLQTQQIYLGKKKTDELICLASSRKPESWLLESDLCTAIGYQQNTQDFQKDANLACTGLFDECLSIMRYMKRRGFKVQIAKFEEWLNASESISLRLSCKCIFSKTPKSATTYYASQISCMNNFLSRFVWPVYHERDKADRLHVCLHTCFETAAQNNRARALCAFWLMRMLTDCFWKADQSLVCLSSLAPALCQPWAGDSSSGWFFPGLNSQSRQTSLLLLLFVSADRIPASPEFFLLQQNRIPDFKREFRHDLALCRFLP